jgi:DNA-binding MarR family transcriptional regulator
MAPRFDDLVDLDRTVHEPVRLGILTALSACQSASFRFLQALLGLTQGNLGTHLHRLEEAGLIEVVKRFAGKTPETRVRLTDAGRAAIEQHWAKLQQLRQATDGWQYGDEPGSA